MIRHSLYILVFFFFLISDQLAIAEVLSTESLVIGINSDGSLITNDAAVGIRYDVDGPMGPLPVGPDLLVQGRPWEVWSISFTGKKESTTVINGDPGTESELEFTYSESGETDALIWLRGTAEHEHFSATLLFELSKELEVLWITITLTAILDMTDVSVSRVADGDQDSEHGTYATTNEAIENVVVCEGPLSGKTFALGVFEGIARICRGWCTEPSQVLSGVTGPYSGDQIVGAAIEAGTLLEEESVDIQFVYAFSGDRDIALDNAAEHVENFDHDGDGFTPEDGDCEAMDPRIHPDAEETPDGIDNNCDGTVDENTTVSDDDDDGYSEAEGDCDDDDDRIHPGAEPVEGVVDANCDGVADRDPWPRDGGQPDGWGVEETGPDAGPDADEADPDADMNSADSDSESPPNNDENGCGNCSTQGSVGGSAAPFFLVLFVLWRARQRNRR